MNTDESLLQTWTWNRDDHRDLRRFFHVLASLGKAPEPHWVSVAFIEGLELSGFDLDSDPVGARLFDLSIPWANPRLADFHGQDCWVLDVPASDAVTLTLMGKGEPYNA